MMSSTLADARPSVLFVIDMTPHTCLRPNDRTDERTKAKHRKTLREAAALATHQLLVWRPRLAQEMREGRLRLTYHIHWERGRQRLDGDAALIVLKGATDSIAAKLGRDDRDFVFMPVEQSVGEERQGYIVVMIEREVLS